jgi:hypothetical protein
LKFFNSGNKQFRLRFALEQAPADDAIAGAAIQAHAPAFAEPVPAYLISRTKNY